MTPAQREHLAVLAFFDRPMSSEAVAAELRARRHGRGYRGTFMVGRRGTGSATRVLQGLKQQGLVSMRPYPHRTGVTYVWSITAVGQAALKEKDEEGHVRRGLGLQGHHQDAHHRPSR